MHRMPGLVPSNGEDLTRMNHDHDDDADLFQRHLTISTTTNICHWSSTRSGSQMIGSVTASGANRVIALIVVHPCQVLPLSC